MQGSRVRLNVRCWRNDCKGLFQTEWSQIPKGSFSLNKNEEESTLSLVCQHCRSVIQRIRGLLDEFMNLRKFEHESICRHCQDYLLATPCETCSQIIKQHLCHQHLEHYDPEYFQLQYTNWVYKTKNILKTMSTKLHPPCSRCYHRAPETFKDLQNIFRELWVALSAQSSKIEQLFPFADLCLNEIKEMLEDLILQGQMSTVLKKYGMKWALLKEILDFKRHKPLATPLYAGGDYRRNYALDMDDSRLPFISKMLRRGDMPKRQAVVSSFTDLMSDTQKLFKDEQVRFQEENMRKEIEDEKEKKRKTHTGKKILYKGGTQQSESKIIRKGKNLKPLDKKTRKKKKISNSDIEAEENIRSDGNKLVSKTDNLPNKIYIIKKTIHPTESPKVITKKKKLRRKRKKKESSNKEPSDTSLYMVCKNQALKSPTEIIRGSKIVTLKTHEDLKRNQVLKEKPVLLYRLREDFPPFEILKPKSSTENKELGGPTLLDDKRLPRENLSKIYLQEEDFQKIVSFGSRTNQSVLMLPSTDVKRKIKLFKMVPNNRLSWFERHKNEKELFYKSGEKLAEIYSDGHGRLFYRNGKLALDYYKAEETNIGSRYVIYDCVERGNITHGLQSDNDVCILGCFDLIGNGVVFDAKGNVRLKYNQTEGKVLDQKIGPVCKWKWHNLNEPPDLQTTHVDNYATDLPIGLQEIITANKSNLSTIHTQNIASHNNLEINNELKRKAKAYAKKFQPFVIKRKIFKVNEYFAIHIVDQSNIFLYFRDKSASLKFNLGMTLLSNEFVQSEIVDLMPVWTPYDAVLPTSPSVQRIMNIVNKTKKLYKNR